MKAFMVIALLSSFTLTAKAQVAEAITTGAAGGAAFFGVSSTSIELSPKCQGTWDCWDESFLSSTLTPVAAMITSTLAGSANKEEIRLAKEDAMVYLAGFEMTLALEETINFLRSSHEDLENVSDETIAATIASMN